MFKKEIRAIVAGSDHFIRRLLHEPNTVCVLPDNGALAGVEDREPCALVTSRPIGVLLATCSAPAMGPFTDFADPGEYEFHSCDQLAAIGRAQKPARMN